MFLYPSSVFHNKSCIRNRCIHAWKVLSFFMKASLIHPQSRRTLCVPLELTFFFLQIVKSKFETRTSWFDALAQFSAVAILPVTAGDAKQNHLHWQLSLNPSLEESLVPSPARKHHNLWKQTVCCFTCAATFPDLATRHGQWMTSDHKTGCLCKTTPQDNTLSPGLWPSNQAF